MEKLYNIFAISVQAFLVADQLIYHRRIKYIRDSPNSAITWGIEPQFIY